VNAAFHFDHQLVAMAVKVEDEMVQRMLASELQAAQLLVLKPFLQGRLSRSHFAAKLFHPLPDCRRCVILRSFLRHSASVPSGIGAVNYKRTLTENKPKLPPLGDVQGAYANTAIRPAR
jgi:hypothetical protein